jgi:hypothetical protein
VCIFLLLFRGGCYPNRKGTARLIPRQEEPEAGENPDGARLEENKHTVFCSKKQQHAEILLTTKRGPTELSTRATIRPRLLGRSLSVCTAFDEQHPQHIRRDTMMWKNIGIGVAVLVVIALSFVYLRPVVADDHMAHMEQMITGAKTAADHNALAAMYDKEAQEARQKQAEHLKMKEWYEQHPALNKTNFSFHCQQIALKYEEMAKEYKMLAKMHRDMATAGK